MNNRPVSVTKKVLELIPASKSKAKLTPAWEMSKEKVLSAKKDKKPKKAEKELTVIKKLAPRAAKLNMKNLIEETMKEELWKKEEWKNKKENNKK